MSLGIRGWASIIGALAVAAVIIYLVIANKNLQAQLADQTTRTAREQTYRVAAQASEASCKAALGTVNHATEYLATATQSAYATVDLALQRGSTRDQHVSQDIQRLLSIRPAEGKDCETALALGQAAWEEKQ